jgi:acyl dehydratase
MPESRFYLDDLYSGQRFTSATHAVDAEQITGFARKFDPQPFHLDDAAAKPTLFGGLAASGWHTAALTMKLLVAGTPIAGGIIGTGGEIAWPRPTRPGDLLRVETEVIEVARSKSKPDRGIATLRSETKNQRDEVVQAITVRILVPARPAIQ